MSAMDKDLAATLTPEELEAINSTDDQSSVNEQDDAALKAVANQAANKTDDNDDDTDENAAPVEGKGAAPDKNKAGEGSTTDDDKAPAAANQNDDEANEPKARKSDFVPRYKADLPENYKETLGQLSEDETKLKERFKAGEIEFDEFEEARSQIQDQRSTLERAALKAEISQEMNEQTAQQTWENTVHVYIKSVKAEIDYTKDVEKQADFDQFVKVLAANPKNQDKSMEWFLEEGHRRVKALHGLTSTPAKEDTPDPKVKANNSRKPPLDAAPKNLSQVPGADGPGDVEDEFSDMDRLEGEDLELAIAKMTPAQRERYLQA